ncbi:MAG: GNAT family N-acetyltransferase [Massiliimalia sp.]|jgi:ribosomal protein S18 acetylase RimI-like enzyme
MEIRELQAKDRDVFIQMVDDFYHSEAVLHDIPKENILHTADLLIEGTPYAKGYLFEQNGETAGYGQISLTYSNEAGGLCVWVEEVMILPQFRGQGLGHEFFHFLHREFSQAKRFRLEVTKENPRAAKLYEKLGYEPFDYLQMVKEC